MGVVGLKLKLVQSSGKVDSWLESLFVTVRVY
jgi:hypothetical protein